MSATAGKAALASGHQCGVSPRPFDHRIEYDEEL